MGGLHGWIEARRRARAVIRWIDGEKGGSRRWVDGYGREPSAGRLGPGPGPGGPGRGRGASPSARALSLLACGEFPACGAEELVGGARGPPIPPKIGSCEELLEGGVLGTSAWEEFLGGGGLFSSLALVCPLSLSWEEFLGGGGLFSPKMGSRERGVRGRRRWGMAGGLGGSPGSVGGRGRLRRHWAPCFQAARGFRSRGRGCFGTAALWFGGPRLKRMPCVGMD